MKKRILSGMRPTGPLHIGHLFGALQNSDTVTIAKPDSSLEFTGKLNLSPRDRHILLAGGLLNYTKTG